MEQENETLSKALLGVGFLALAGGVFAAYAEPATRYELSVYAGTPIAFWVGTAAAALVAVGVSLFARRDALSALGVVLGGGAFAAVVGLPILRNYHFYGTADALTHLAWTRGVVAGEKELLSLLYPAIHTIAAYVGTLAGYPTTRSLLYVVTLLAVVFVAFVPLAAWALTRDRRTTAIAAFGAMTLLPITNVSSKLIAHPTTQAILFVPLVVYLLVRYLRSERDGLEPTAAGVALGVALLAFVLFHPQQALNLLAMLGAIAGLQWLVRRRRGAESPIAATRPVYAQTGLLAVAFLVWAPRHGRFSEPATAAVERIGRVLTGRMRVGAETGQRAASLSELGTGLPELYLKLFAVPTVFCVAAGALLLVVLAGRLDDDDSFVAPFGRLLIAGFVPVTAVFAIYVVGQFGTQSFRHLSYLFAFATLFGAIGIAYGWDALADRQFGSVASVVVAVAIALALAVAVASFFPSPWIYLHSQHVTEAQMDGYETAFDHTSEADRFFGVRSGPDRYADAYTRDLVTEDDRFRPLEERAMTSDLSERYGDGWYFALTRVDRMREVGAYQGLRYSGESFEAAANQRGVNRVVDNGEFRLFYVSG